MREIRLNRKKWRFYEGQPLGRPGGFGQVFIGEDGVAIKKLNVHPLEAKRELALAEFLVGRDLPNVVPVFDAGEDAESGEHFVVMARCQKNLREHLHDDGSPGLQEVLDILKPIAAGLSQVGDIVHRDIKPENVLLHDRNWKHKRPQLRRHRIRQSRRLTIEVHILKAGRIVAFKWRASGEQYIRDVYALGCIAAE